MKELEKSTAPRELPRTASSIAASMHPMAVL
jgi:hypothetical protein